MIKYLIFIVLLISSCNFPKKHNLSVKGKLELTSVKNYLKCENIEETYSSETSGNVTNKYFTIELIDKKRKNINYDSINNVLLDIYEKDGMSLKHYKEISIFFINDESEADLDRVYYLDNKRNVLAIKYD